MSPIHSISNILNIQLWKYIVYQVAIFIFFYAQNASGQVSSQDSIHYKKAAFFAYKNSDSLMYYAKKMMLSEDRCFALNGKLNLSNAYYRKGNFKKSEEIALELYDDFQKESPKCHPKHEFNTLGRLFWITKNQNRFKEALKHLLKQENLISSISNNDKAYHLKLGSFYSNMGLIEMELGHYETAKQKLEKAINVLQEEENDIGLIDDYKTLIITASSYNILGEVYLNMSKHDDNTTLDSAFYSFKKAYDISQRFNPTHEDSETLYNIRLAKLMIKKKEFNNALEKINKYSPNQDKYKTSQQINYLKSIIFYHLKDLDSSLIYSNRFLSFQRETPSTEKNTIIVLNILAEQYKELNKIDSAYKYSALALDKLNDLNENKVEANNSHYLYDFEKVKSLNNDILSKERSKRVQIVLIFQILVLVSIFIIIILYWKRRKLVVDLENIKQSFIPTKKEYSIDESLERKVLSKLITFENSTLFLASDFNIQILAKELDTNTSYLSSIINEKKKKTFKKYISELRINYLIKRLKSDAKLRSYTVQALAEEIGYTNASAFTRAFKKQLGVTPSEFLKTIPD